MAIIANNINIINSIISIGDVQQNIGEIYASHNGVDTLVWTNRNFLNIEYSNNVITRAWLDIENDKKGTQIAVFSTGCAEVLPNDVKYKEVDVRFNGRRLINSSQTNAEIQNALNGFNIGSGVVGITRLEAAPSPSFSNEWYGYRATSGSDYETSVGTKLTHIIQDCAPNFEFSNSVCTLQYKTFMHWKWRVRYEVFGQTAETENGFETDIPGPVTEGPKDPGSIIYAEKTPEAGTIRVALDSTDRYKIRIYGQNNIDGVTQSGPDFTTITKL